MKGFVAGFVLVAACTATPPRPTSSEPAAADTPTSDADDATSGLAARIDAVMQPWANDDAPGCAVGVIQHGALTYAKGYGMADLEHGVAITPDTVFYVGSVSKQFTAAAVLLAAADGRLSLDDDIRTHVPSLPQLGPTPTTLRHLIHHTGGLRDYGTLLILAGHRIDDAPTVSDALDVLSRQRGRDFPPGATFEYSNTGYVLLAQAVEHATQQSFAAYLDAKVFAPLHMTRTRVRESHREIVPGRAVGYAPDGDGWRIDEYRWAPAGSGGVLTTVEDLAKWDENFYDPKVGGPAFVDAQLQRGKLGDGTEIDYAAGLFHASYRGQPTVVHPGGAAGFVAQFERFPKLHASIAVLCNARGARPDLLAHRIADIVLEADLDGAPPPQEAVLPTVELTAAQLDAWVATYTTAETGELGVIVRTGDALELLVAGDRYALDPTDDHTFRLRHEWWVAHVDGTPPHRELVLRSPMNEERFVEAQVAPPSAREFSELVGRYHSDEIGTEWTLAVAGDHLVATGPAFDGPAALVPAAKDDFTIFATPVGISIHVTRDRRGRVTGFTLRSGSMQGVQFDREG